MIQTLGDVRADPRLVQIALAVRLNVNDPPVVVIQRLLCKGSTPAHVATRVTHYSLSRRSLTTR